MRIVVTAKSEKYAALCNEYWQRNKRGQFENRIKALAENYGISKRDITGIIREHCTAQVVEWRCTACGKEYSYDLQTRTDLSSLRLDVKSRICDSCQADWNARKLEVRREFVSSDAGNGVAQSTASVHIELGQTKQCIRFESLTECVIRFSLQREGATVECEVVLKGKAFTSDPKSD